MPNRPLQLAERGSFATQAGAPVQADETYYVTPEMIEAGADAMRGHYPLSDLAESKYREIVRTVYAAMRAAL